MADDLSVPAVVAVVVTCDPGQWLEETLASLADQDYPNLSVLVIDAASTTDPTPRVAAVLPHAFVRRLEQRVGFGRAANEVLRMVEGASHFLLCHDDVALEPDAVSQLLDEALRSNAGILTPKLVDWNHPELLLAVGMTTDRVGVSHALIERGELDQGQHDTEREVFFAPSGATLIRADLFQGLGGFDPVTEDHGEDLDLSWRARVAGARVLTAPAAKVRHAEASRNGRRVGTGRPGVAIEADRTSDAHRIRTVLTCCSAVSLLWVLPLLAFFSAGEALTALVTGDPGLASRRLRALPLALRKPGDLLASRRRVQRLRGVPDRSVRKLQTTSNARLREWLRERADGPQVHLPLAAVPGTLGFEEEDDLWSIQAPRPGASPAGSARRSPRHQAALDPTGTGTRRARSDGPSARASTPDGDGAGGEDTTGLLVRGRPAVVSVLPADGGIGSDAQPTIGRTGWRLPVGVAVVALAVWIIGSRNLFGPELPAVGSLPNTSAGIGAFWHAWLSTWQPAGLGSVGPSSPALGLLALAGVICFGAVGTLQHIVVLGPFLVGPLGMYRALRWWGSQRGRVVALVAYALVPLPFDAMARGHWDGLLAYAALPWLLGMMGRLSDSLPYPGTSFLRIGPRLLGIGLLVALVSAFVPSFLLVVLLSGAGLALGSLLTGQVPVAARLMGTALVATVVGFVLLLPWSASVITSRVAMFGASPGAAGSVGVSGLLRMHVGPIGGGVLGWGLLVAAALPLVIGRSWRLAWAARLWALLLVTVLWTWMGLRGWVPVAPAAVALAPAGAAIGGLVGLGVVAFELDLPGYRFGWRQGASAIALAGLIVAAVPVLGATGTGRWHLPAQGPTTVMAAEQRVSGGDYRMLWVGAPDAIPTASATFGNGQAYATSWNGLPDVTDQWPDGPPAGGATLLADLRLAQGGLTTKLGHLLAPYGIRYLVIPNHNGAAGGGAAAEAVPNQLVAGLALQTDMRAIGVDPDYSVWVNTAWMPARAVLSPSAEAASKTATPDVSSTLARGTAGARLLEQTDLSALSPVLSGGRPDQVSGRVAGGSSVYVAAGSPSSWTVSVGGRQVHAQPAFGVGMRFDLPAGASGTATLQANTSGIDRVLQLVFAGLALLVVVLVSLDRRRRSRARSTDETVRPEWFTPLAPTRSRGSAGRRAMSSTPKGMDTEEVWTDA